MTHVGTEPHQRTVGAHSLVTIVGFLVCVELKTGTKNVRSRNAILRLGAKEEGILRHHIIQPDGSYRDTVYFSILDEEWPAVKQRLEQRLSA